MDITGKIQAAIELSVRENRTVDVDVWPSALVFADGHEYTVDDEAWGETEGGQSWRLRATLSFESSLTEDQKDSLRSTIADICDDDVDLDMVYEEAMEEFEERANQGLSLNGYEIGSRYTKSGNPFILGV